MTRAPARMLALAATLALGLTACSSDGTDSSAAASGDDRGGGAGTITFDGEQLELENVICTQVAVEGNAWRVLADIEGTDDDITMNEGGGTTLMIDGVRWSNRGGDDTPQLDVGEHGVSGHNGMYSEDDLDADVELSADISC